MRDPSGRTKQIRAVTGTTVHTDLSYAYAASTGADTARVTSRGSTSGFALTVVVGAALVAAGVAVLLQG